MSKQTDFIPSTNRIEAFSDGVIAIIITIMVLELKVPHLAHEFTSKEALDALILMTPKFIGYALSFLMVAIFWTNHHTVFHGLSRSTRALVWHNNHFLFWLSLIPFCTAFLGEHPYQTVPVMLYGGAVLGSAIAFDLMLFHAGKAGLYDEKISPEFIRKLNKKSLYGPVLYAIAVLLAPLSVYLSLIIYLLIPIFYFLPEKILERD